MTNAQILPMIDCVADQLMGWKDFNDQGDWASRLIQVKFVLISSMVVYVYLAFIWRVRKEIVFDCLAQNTVGQTS